MIIKNKRIFVIAKEAQVYDADEIYNKLKRPLIALRRLKQEGILPETFREIALSDLEQAVFLLDGAKDLSNDNEITEKDIHSK